ncbi:ADP-ribose glycohydrolase MACROD1 isoform X3 [Thalassophryne amazonica]|uniref:ADP-ribose glycohydrolase MACROD1 isoform X3 n=1 Tax=Thalassophryne amazonica TaxID=390379 RepID=UPI00147230AA|nr:ADP-ribose glycohydrolase MACROD1 isoform X3 [Thalassophryne amazonica]
MFSDSLCRNSLALQTECYSSCLDGWSQVVLEVNKLDVEVLCWCGYMCSAIVRPVGCTAKFPEMPLDMAEEFLLSLSVKDRREYYRTSSFVPLDDIPMWSPTKDGDGKQTFHLGKISLYSGDITKLEIDAIVNAANNSLLGGGGVDGAIHRAAGPLLKKECASLHGCETGQAKITCGYGLPAKYVIHTVGPIAVAGVGEQQKSALRSCYKKCLETATKNGVRSVAFPCISTGIYGYPPEQAVHVALATVREYLDEHHDKVDRVIFCVFLPMDKELYLQNLPLYFTAAPTQATVKSKL